MLADKYFVDCIDSFPNTTMSNEFKNILIKRWASRRTVWSDILWYLNSFDIILPNKNLLFKIPDHDIMKKAIERVFNGFVLSNIVTEEENCMNTALTNSDVIELLKNPTITKTIQNSIPDLEEELIRFKVKRQRGPLLDYAVKNLMAIKPTSIDSERAFSVCGRIMTPQRSKMSDKSLEAIVFINQNKSL